MTLRIRKGHFVEVYRDASYKTNPWWPNDDYTDVYGQTFTRTSRSAGWYTMSRELPRRRAVKFAKAYQRAGFQVRIRERYNGGTRITDEFSQKRNYR